jgi:nitroreductase
MKYTLTQQIQLKHASVRKFLKRPLHPGQLEKLIKCGQSASSSNFIQAYSIIRVQDREVRAKIASAAGGQKWVESAPEFLVFCADLQKINVVCRYTGKGELDGYSEHALAAIIDVSILAQNVMIAAESDGLGGVFIGGIRNQPEVIAKQLSLPELVVPVFGMCLGWPDQKTETKPRMPVDYVLHNDIYSEIDEDSIK